MQSSSKPSSALSAASFDSGRAVAGSQSRSASPHTVSKASFHNENDDHHADFQNSTTNRRIDMSVVGGETTGSDPPKMPETARFREEEGRSSGGGHKTLGRTLLLREDTLLPPEDDDHHGAYSGGAANHFSFGGGTKTSEHDHLNNETLHLAPETARGPPSSLPPPTTAVPASPSLGGRLASLIPGLSSPGTSSIVTTTDAHRSFTLSESLADSNNIGHSTSSSALSSSHDNADVGGSSNNKPRTPKPATLSEAVNIVDLFEASPQGLVTKTHHNNSCRSEMSTAAAVPSSPKPKHKLVSAVADGILKLRSKSPQPSPAPSPGLSPRPPLLDLGDEGGALRMRRQSGGGDHKGDRDLPSLLRSSSEADLLSEGDKERHHDHHRTALPRDETAIFTESSSDTATTGPPPPLALGTTLATGGSMNDAAECGLNASKGSSSKDPSRQSPKPEGVDHVDTQRNPSRGNRFMEQFRRSPAPAPANDDNRNASPSNHLRHRRENDNDNACDHNPATAASKMTERGRSPSASPAPAPAPPSPSTTSIALTAAQLLRAKAPPFSLLGSPPPSSPPLHSHPATDTGANGEASTSAVSSSDVDHKPQDVANNPSHTADHDQPHHQPQPAAHDPVVRSLFAAVPSSLDASYLASVALPTIAKAVSAQGLHEEQLRIHRREQEEAMAMQLKADEEAARAAALEEAERLQRQAEAEHAAKQKLLFKLIAMSSVDGSSAGGAMLEMADSPRGASDGDGNEVTTSKRLSEQEAEVVSHDNTTTMTVEEVREDTHKDVTAAHAAGDGKVVLNLPSDDRIEHQKEDKRSDDAQKSDRIDEDASAAVENNKPSPDRVGASSFSPEDVAARVAADPDGVFAAAVAATVMANESHAQNTTPEHQSANSSLGSSSDSGVDDEPYSNATTNTPPGEETHQHLHAAEGHSSHHHGHQMTDSPLSHHLPSPLTAAFSFSSTTASPALVGSVSSHTHQSNNHGTNLHGFRDYVCGTLSGIGKVVAGYPFDTLKGRVQGGNFGGSVKRAFFETLHKEGITAFYQGVTFPAVNVCFVGGILFYVNGAIRSYQQPDGCSPLTYGQMFVAGVGGGAAVGLWTVPVEVLKIRMQLLNKSTAEVERFLQMERKAMQRETMRSVLDPSRAAVAESILAKSADGLSSSTVLKETNFPPFKPTAALIEEEARELSMNAAMRNRTFVGQLVNKSRSAVKDLAGTSIPRSAAETLQSSAAIAASLKDSVASTKPILNNARSIAASLKKADFFAGFTPTMIRECGTFGLFFPLNEYFKRKIALKRDKIDLEMIQKRQAEQKRARLYGLAEGRLGHDIVVPQPCFTTRVLAAGLAGIFCWLPVYPADQIKTRMQLHPAFTYKSWLHCGGDIIKKEGIKVGLFKGLGPCLVRAFPAYAAQFLLYEKLIDYWGKQ